MSLNPMVETTPNPTPEAALPRYLFGTSLKMYFSHARTLDWITETATRAAEHRLITAGIAGLFLMPQFPSIPACLGAAGPLLIGAQDLAVEDEGAWTGEVSGAVLSELGCRLVEVGHAERRHHFGETDELVRGKVQAAVRNGLIPVLCVGEKEETNPADAAAAVLAEVTSALPDTDPPALVIAYEPVWAIGAPRPAQPAHIRQVCSILRDHLRSRLPGTDSRIIYGGSAGPGLLTEIGTIVDGLFLGRFAHDPAAVGTILDELCDLVGDPA